MSGFFIVALSLLGVTGIYYLYGANPESQPGTEGLNAFFLLVDKPEVYNLPPDPVAPAKKIGQSWAAMAIGSLGILAAAAAAVISARKSNP